MGRQIHFYMTEQDEIDFMRWMRSRADVIVLPQTTDLPTPESFEHPSDLIGRQHGSNCHLWNRSISVEPTYQHFPEQGYYCLDFLKADVISFWASSLRDDELSKGRLHMEEIFFHDDELWQKSELFVRWYNSLCSWIRRNFKQRVESAYASPRASTLFEGGVAPRDFRPI